MLEKLNAGRGVGFICYPGKRTGWNLPPFPGMEIYNTHGDAETKQANLGVFSKAISSTRSPFSTPSGIPG